jgi:hypothetical protein
VANVSNVASSPGGLDVFETAVYLVFAAVGVWCLVRHPVVVVAVAVGLVAWWEAGPGAPLWPWLAGLAWATVAGLRWVARLVWTGRSQ